MKLDNGGQRNIISHINFQSNLSQMKITNSNPYKIPYFVDRLILLFVVASSKNQLETHKQTITTRSQDI